MRAPRRPARELRRTIDAMPLETRKAMLAGIGPQPKDPARPGAPDKPTPIIVGAYASSDGGICPMLAAHRNGGRTSYAPFARAWDRYARAGTRTRLATDGELTALRAMLEASIADASVAGPGVLAGAIADHRRALRARLRREEHDVEPYERTDPRALDARAAAKSPYSSSPGRTNCSSGTMHAGEVLSR